VTREQKQRRERWAAASTAVATLDLVLVAYGASGVANGLLCLATGLMVTLAVISIQVAIDEYQRSGSGLRAIGAAVVFFVCVDGLIVIVTSQVPQLQRFDFAMGMFGLLMLGFAGIMTPPVIIAGSDQEEGY